MTFVYFIVHFRSFFNMCVPFQVRSKIQGSFDQVRKALDMREKLLNRQLQVLEQQANQLTKIEFIPENEVALLHILRTYGRINVQKLNVCSDFLTNEDYICPQDDHVLINKQLVEEDLEEYTNQNVALNLVDDNANNINESLINLILSESKELIGAKALNLKPKNKEGRHGNSKTAMQIVGDTPAPITLRAPTTTMDTNKAPKHSSKRAIDKLNGTTAAVVSSKKKFTSFKGLPISTTTTTPVTTTKSASANPRRPTAIIPANANQQYEVQAVTCEFYNRLISENELFRPKRTPTGKRPTDAQKTKPTALEVSPTSSSTSGTSSTSFKGFCEDFEKKGIVCSTISLGEDGDAGTGLDANGNFSTSNSEIVGDRPKQIQLWLKQIIHEPELEPMQNTDLLEFSRIKKA